MATRCNNRVCKKYGRPVWFRLPKGAPPSPPEIPLGYGLLYNWYAATDVRGIAPDGWRVPTETDHLILQFFLGNDQANKLASTRSFPEPHPRWASVWTPPQTNATMFSAFPSGNRQASVYESFGLNYFGISITSGGFSPPNFVRVLNILDNSMNPSDVTPRFAGCSVRCLRDTLPPSPTVTDADGNTYTWVQIGAQYWLAQNLKTTRYNNGDPIPTGLDNTAWASTTDGAWAYPNGDPTLPI